MYEQEIREKQTIVDKLNTQCTQLSLLRLLIFVAGLILGYFIVAQGSTVSICVFVVVWIALFLYIVTLHNRKHESLIFESNWMLLCKQEQEALGGNYSAFANGIAYANSNHAFSHDLDIFGEHSFFQSLNRSHSVLGEGLLVNHLLKQELSSECIRWRQEAIHELKDKQYFRMYFRTLAYAFRPKDRMPQWNIGELKNVNWKLLSVLFSILNACVFLLCLFHVVSWSFIIMLPLIGLGSLCFFSNRITKRMNMHDKNAHYLSQCVAIMNLIDKESFHSKLLMQQKELLSSKKSAMNEIRKLCKIIHQFEYRNNLFVGIFLNMFFLWDFKCMGNLQTWEQSNVSDVSSWMDALKVFDSFNSLGFYAYNHPTFIYPDLALPEEMVLEFKNVAHPLLDVKQSVGNDFNTLEDTPFSIITGANMAGKSTFLRSAGLNIVMACAGLPVCAEAMRYSPVQLYSSMRTTDSIAKGESYFLAELKRLQYLLEETKAKNGSVFILLDEILKGTNSKDKAAGSRLVMKRFLSLNAHGIIATHDLELCDLANEFPEQVSNYCFEIKHEGAEMIFDYKMKRGITQNMNALFLIERMGLG